jgi:predicted  nucleic acid-binding Zn-ribbon protein
MFGFTSADRAVLNGLAASMRTVLSQLEKIMSEQSELDTAAEQIEADVTAENTAIAAIQAEIAALKAAAPSLDFTGLDKAVADLGTAETSLEAVEPPPAPSA